MITEEMIRAGRRTSLGSTVCKMRVIEDGIATVYLHSAISMSKEDFTEGGTGEKNYHRLETFFSHLHTYMGDALFSFKGASYEQEYGVFTFSAPEGWLCLTDLQLPFEPQTAEDIFVSLLKIIDTYSKCPINGNGYRPLLFICRESVYVHFAEDGKLDGVKLLPMPYDMETMYEGMPREIYRKKADISADIYMSAYLYLLLKYTDEQSFEESEFTEYDRLAEQCLSPFALRRPSLGKLLAAEKESEEPALEPPTPPIPPSLTKEPNSFMIITGDTESSSDSKKQHGGFGIGKKKFFKKDKKKSVISRAKDKFDEMLSTEEADAAEEDT